MDRLCLGLAGAHGDPRLSALTSQPLPASTSKLPDVDRFPALRLARETLEEGGAAPIVLNAANEVTVAAFLAGRIAFPEIAPPRSRKRLLTADYAAPANYQRRSGDRPSDARPRQPHDDGGLPVKMLPNSPAVADPHRIRVRAGPARLLS